LRAIRKSYVLQNALLLTFLVVLGASGAYLLLGRALHLS
jgi:hypothetical protein